MTTLTPNNGICEADYFARFPLPYCTRYLTFWESNRLGLDVDDPQWVHTAPFIYNSDKYGQIYVPIEATTDGASVPRQTGLLTKLTRVAPHILPASGPHDRLFEQIGLTYQPLDEKTKELLAAQGLLAPGQVFRRLTFDQCNEVLAEAMWYCDATKKERTEAYFAVSVGGKILWNRHCDEQGLPQFKA